MKEKSSGERFWKIAFICYLVTIIAVYVKIYVFHAYPIYRDESQIPDALASFEKIGSYFHN